MPGERLPFLRRERCAFAGRAADEGKLHAAGEQMCRLLFDHREIERAVRVEGRVRGGDEALDG